MRGSQGISENGPGRRARRSLAAALLCAATLPLAFAVAAAPVQAQTDVYDEVATETIFVVPGGVHELSFVAIGGSGGDAQDGVGGAGAKVSGRLAVTPGQTLYIEVGQNGEDLADGGGPVFGGGAAGGAGGGGASDIRTEPGAAGLSPDPRLLVAGAGGGAGASGITEFGGNGGDAEMEGGAGSYPGGGAGTQTEGGVGATGCLGTTGDNGTRGSGGEGGDAEEVTGPGGGGGGGYFGGGGGGGACEIGSGGGGGGSSLIPPLGIATLASASASPLIEITWYPPPTVAFVAPTNGATYAQGQAVSANYSCQPGAGAILQSCVGTVVNGASIDTSSVGLHTFSVEAEDKTKGKTTQSVAYAVVKKSEATPPAPNTLVGSHPKKVIKSKKKMVKVKFGFSSDITGSTFECKLDKGAYASCASPKTYKVKLGSHVFSVRAKSAGVVDPTSATYRFKVKKKV